MEKVGGICPWPSSVLGAIDWLRLVQSVDGAASSCIGTLQTNGFFEAVGCRDREDVMKIGFGVAAVIAFLAAFASVPVTAAEILTLQRNIRTF